MAKVFCDAAERETFRAWLQQFRSNRFYFGMLRRADLTHLILADWRQNPVRATKFWGYVLRGNHPDSEHPTRELNDAIVDLWHAEQRYKYKLKRKLERLCRRMQRQVYMLELEADNARANDA